jgi:hypothetical protein
VVFCLPLILEDIVGNINAKRSSCIKPMQEELEQVNKKLADIKRLRDKYFNLFEKDFIDDEELGTKLNELSTSKNHLSLKKAELESKLSNDMSEPIPYEYVKEILSDLQNNLKNALPEQEKQLLHLFIENIELDSNRKIQHIKLNFDERVHRNFLNSKEKNTEESSDDEDSSHILKKREKSYKLFMIRFTPIYPKPPIHLLKQYYLHKLMRESH